MNTLLRKPLIIFASLIMMVMVLILPQVSSAKMFISDGSSPGSPGGGEGDPLDSNDYSGDGDDGAVHQRRDIPRDFNLTIFDLGATSTTILVQVEYLGNVPVFTFHVVNISDYQSEAKHVR